VYPLARARHGLGRVFETHLLCQRVDDLDGRHGGQ
jgi:hypothetical protein